MKDELFEIILSKYMKELNQLSIGYPVSNDTLEDLWKMIHERHFVNFENSSPLVLNILEYYEYV